jgi:hypothetical protein
LFAEGSPAALPAAVPPAATAAVGLLQEVPHAGEHQPAAARQPERGPRKAPPDHAALRHSPGGAGFFFCFLSHLFTQITPHQLKLIFFYLFSKKKINDILFLLVIYLQEYPLWIYLLIFYNFGSFIYANNPRLKWIFYLLKKKDFISKKFANNRMG